MPILVQLDRQGHFGHFLVWVLGPTKEPCVTRLFRYEYSYIVLQRVTTQYVLDGTQIAVQKHNHPQPEPGTVEFVFGM